MSQNKTKGPNAAVTLMQELGALPETDQQRIDSTRAELIQMHSTAVGLLKAQEPLAEVIRSDAVMNSPHVKEITEVVQGIVKDSIEIKQQLITAGQTIKKMDAIKDPDQYLLQSINVHQSLVGTIETYQATVVPQLVHFDELVMGTEQVSEPVEVAQ